MLRRLLDDRTLTITDLANAARISGNQTIRKLDKLHQINVVRATRAVINWRTLGYKVEVSLHFTLDRTQCDAFDAFIVAAREMPEIQTFLGKVDVRLNVIARDMAHYRRLYCDRILSLLHIADIEALMLVGTIRVQGTLPM